MFRNKIALVPVITCLCFNVASAQPVSYSTLFDNSTFSRSIDLSKPVGSQEFEHIYYNRDSVRDMAKQKNDSLRQVYSYGYEQSILLTEAHNKKRDTIRIREHACYHLTFTDGRTTEFGVVQKITSDSITIANFFNKEMAVKNKAQYELYGYPIAAIQKVSLLRSGGYSFHTIEMNDLTLSIINEAKTATGPPYWFAVHPTTGELKFYRLWQTDKGYAGITETQGNAIWYEGEARQ